jgi:indoleamine 2,3-dioxygenase
MLTSITAPRIDPKRGFLPSQDSLTRLPIAFDAWENAAIGLPKLLASDHLRRTLEDLPPFPLDQITNDRERERAMLLLSYLGHAYVWRGERPA